jgi:hypothetical protein
VRKIQRKRRRTEREKYKKLCIYIRVCVCVCVGRMHNRAVVVMRSNESATSLSPSR